MSTIHPRFSVLLPTHNRADVLGVAIESVLAQTEPDFELLIVADGCTDKTIEIIGKFNDTRIRVFDLPKAPFFGYANRNIALRESRGRLIAYMPHDDLMLPDHLELMGNLLDSTKASWGYSRPLWVSTDGVIVPFCTNLTLDDERTYFLEQRNTIPAISVVHTKKALVEAGYWPENISTAADWDLWKNILRANDIPPAYLRQPTSLHFSADWKNCRHSKMPEVQTLLSIRDQAKWWPHILQPRPKDKLKNEPIQIFLWEAIKAGKTPWVSSLRAAIDVIVEKITWKAVQESIAENKTASQHGKMAAFLQYFFK